ncbi:MAG TPA: hypothetical protein PLF98_08205, partial [Thermotogota bacterium]|nr:hypothetical protein [Thermotogota bacterium]
IPLFLLICRFVEYFSKPYLLDGLRILYHKKNIIRDSLARRICGSVLFFGKKRWFGTVSQGHGKRLPGIARSQGPKTLTAR